MSKILVCKKDPNHGEFLGSATEYVTWVVDAYGNWLKTDGHSDASLSRDGAFTCAICGEYAHWMEVSEGGHLPGTVGYWLDENDLIFSNGHFDEYPELQACPVGEHCGVIICKLLQDLHNLWANDDVPGDTGTLDEAREHLIAAGVIQARVWYYG